jgi:YfiH family protein
LSHLLANWPAPKGIHAGTTTRMGGHSLPPYNNNNFGYHVGDNEQHVTANRCSLVKALQLTNEPIWLEQTHSNHCIVAENDSNRSADASVTRDKNLALMIMTADCLPLILCNQNGTEIAAIHAGWRGLANGIVENTLANMHSSPETLMAWIGPAICQKCYPVGQEMQDTYMSRYPYTKTTFHYQGSNCYANLPKIAELILNQQGITHVFQSGACTFELQDTFYSYRREAQTGRMATFISFHQDK